MLFTTFFGEDKACSAERISTMGWYSELSPILLPSAFCTQYCGLPDYPGERMPLFDGLCLEAANRQLEGTKGAVTTNILSYLDLIFLDSLIANEHTVGVLYIGKPEYFRANKELLDAILVRREYIHIRGKMK